MRLFSLAFLLGILLLQNFSSLPEKKWLMIFILVPILYFWPRLLSPSFINSVINVSLQVKIKSSLHVTRLLIAAFILGFVWCLWYAHAQMSWSLPEYLEEKNIIATGYIASIPDITKMNSSFLFKVENIQFANKILKAHGLLRLNWRNAHFKKNSSQFLAVGDKWQFQVRLKKVHGLMNPGGFDFEAYAFQEGIRATGYVINDDKDNKLLNSHWYHYSLHRIREFLKLKIEKNLPHTETSPWIVALILGERHGIEAKNWEILRNTGTNHLMAIAGLHIGFMSGFAYTFISWLWRRSGKLLLIIPSQQIGAIAALLIAFLYSALAGFSIPTQRACIMLAVFLCMQLLRRNSVAWQAWSLALIIVLLINPLCVLTESFWLSFGAVALIIYGVNSRLAPKGFWWKWGRIQWVITLGLIPFSFWLFQQSSIVSLIANSIAIPWVGFLIVPFCLLGSFILLFSDQIGSYLLIFADKSLGLLWIVLTWLAHLSWSSWYQVIPNLWSLIVACLGMAILLLPIGFPGRWLGGIGLLPLFFYHFPVPLKGEVWLALLDVGQGLSTVIQTQKHILVFDTGAKLSSNNDMGESVVMPYLRSIGIQNLDMLIISHGDNDHIGGASAILKNMPVLKIKTSVPNEFSIKNTDYCLRGDTWIWDDVIFKFLYPTLHHLGFNNDSSCVLRISTKNKTILLTGDIEKYAENYLLDVEDQNLRANIIIAPHHGSKTSALDAFLYAVNPQYVLFPVGYRNRYHLPHPSVVAKYDALNAKKFDTAKAGAIQLKVVADKISQPILFREHHRHYWNN